MLYLLTLPLRGFWWRLFGRRVKKLEDFLHLIEDNKWKIDTVIFKIRSSGESGYCGSTPFFCRKIEIYTINRYNDFGYRIRFQEDVPGILNKEDSQRVFTRVNYLIGEVRKIIGEDKELWLLENGKPKFHNLINCNRNERLRKNSLVSNI